MKIHHTWLSIHLKFLDECIRIYETKTMDDNFEDVRNDMIKRSTKKFDKYERSADFEMIQKFEPKLFPKNQSFLAKWILRLFAFIIGLYCGMIVVSEAFLLFRPEYTLIYYSIDTTHQYILLWVYSILFLVSMC